VSHQYLVASAGQALDLPPRPIAFSGRAGESQAIELAAQVEQAKLWWTWDQGPQNLYTAEATLADNGGALIDRLSVTFGIRTLERDSNMLYRLNGRPVFLRGAWEPMITQESALLLGLSLLTLHNRIAKDVGGTVPFNLPRPRLRSALPPALAALSAENNFHQVLDF
jgi:hypothetical protein